MSASAWQRAVRGVGVGRTAGFRARKQVEPLLCADCAAAVSLPAGRLKRASRLVLYLSVAEVCFVDLVGGVLVELARVQRCCIQRTISGLAGSPGRRDQQFHAALSVTNLSVRRG